VQTRAIGQMGHELDAAMLPLIPTTRAAPKCVRRTAATAERKGGKRESARERERKREREKERKREREKERKRERERQTV